LLERFSDITCEVIEDHLGERNMTLTVFKAFLHLQVLMLVGTQSFEEFRILEFYDHWIFCGTSFVISLENSSENLCPCRLQFYHFPRVYESFEVLGLALEIWFVLS